MRLLSWVFLLLGVPAAALARAGGGGHGGGGGGHGGGGSYGVGAHGWGGNSGAWSGTIDHRLLGMLVLLGLAFLVVAARAWRSGTTTIRARRLAAEQLLAELGPDDALWNLKRMTTRVEEIFFNVQAAWTANNQDLARNDMSEWLYTQHKAQTDAYLVKGQRNVLKDITLQEVAIYSVSDYKNDARDTFSARITGAMTDYVEDAQGAVIAGSPFTRESFTEIWKFARVANQWVLDGITASGGADAVERGVAYSHKAGRKPRASR